MMLSVSFEDAMEATAQSLPCYPHAPGITAMYGVPIIKVLDAMARAKAIDARLDLETGDVWPAVRRETCIPRVAR